MNNVYPNCKTVSHENDLPVPLPPSPEELKSKESSTDCKAAGSEKCESEADAQERSTKNRF